MASPRVLITGITGFVGSHFAEYAIGLGADVWGSYRERSKTDNIDHIRDRLHLVVSDLRDRSSVQVLIEEAKPDYIVHLAGQSYVVASWLAPTETLCTNALSQLNILETIRPRKGKAPRFLAIGSSQEYGLVNEDELPVRETNPLRPLSPYAVSKVTQDLMGYQYFEQYGVPIVRTRAFNHEGPRRGDVFMTSNFAQQIAEIELGKRPPVISVGNLRPRRDFTDVRDIVRGYWRLLEAGQPSEVYNLCSGREWVVHDVLDFMLSQSSVPGIQVKEDPSRLRPSDVPVLVGDAGKIEHAVGWTAQIPFEQTLRDLLDYWRGRVRHPDSS